MCLYIFIVLILKFAEQFFRRNPTIRKPIYSCPPTMELIFGHLLYRISIYNESINSSDELIDLDIP